MKDGISRSNTNPPIPYSPFARTCINAKELVQLYRERYGRDPDEKALHEFFWLFTDGHDELPECWESMMKLGGNYEYTKEQFKKNNKKFKNMDEFLKQI